MALLCKSCRKNTAFRTFSLIIIFGALFSLLGTTYCSSEGAPVFYTLKIPSIRDDVALHVKEGDSVTDPVGKYSIGTVSKVELHAAKVEKYSIEKNEMVLSELEGYSDVYITVSANAHADSAIIDIGAYKVYIGKHMSVRLPDFYGSGVCVGIGGRRNGT